MGGIAITSGSTVADCVPTPCLVQDLRVRECRQVREAIPDLQKGLDISERAMEVLRTTEWTIITASVMTSQTVPCWETGDAFEAPASPQKEVTLLAAAPCTGFTLGSTVH